MSYTTEIWPASKLIKLFDSESLNLNPPYQRNSIWSVQAQKLLIDTIINDMPIPAFFLQEVEDSKYDMVDGQQRTRAIIKYSRPENFSQLNFDFDFNIDLIHNYKIAINILSKNIPIDKVREFYVRVNRTGKRLERPELNKAEYFDTNFLKLVSELSISSEFQDLRIFRESDTKRMFDRDFVEELVAQVSYGVTDKKKTVDVIYKKDISESEFTDLKKEFLETVKIISDFDSIKKLAQTRYSQKNDFYTLFGLIRSLKEKFNYEELNLVYKILIKISPGIRPSNDKCPVLQDYAFNCVTQSNSKKARENRLKTLNSILKNKEKKPNEAQSQIQDFFKVKDKTLIKVGDYYTLNPDA